MWNLLGVEIEAGQTATEVIASSGLSCRSALFGKVSGETGYNVALGLQVSPDEGTTWCLLPFINLTGTNNGTLADALALTTAVTRALAGLSWLPTNWQVRVTLANSGNTTATVSLWLAETED